MKIEELMIGDIILRKDFNNDWRPVRVTLPLLSDIDNYSDHYKPFELTEEFLRSQGFVEDKLRGIVLTSYVYFNNQAIWVLNSFVDSADLSLISSCNYLHELQHFFKLREIEKEFNI